MRSELWLLFSFCASRNLKSLHIIHVFNSLHSSCFFKKKPFQNEHVFFAAISVGGVFVCFKHGGIISHEQQRTILPTHVKIHLKLKQKNKPNERKTKCLSWLWLATVQDTYFNPKLPSSLQHVAGTVYHSEGLSKCGGEVLCCRERLPLLARHQQSKTMCRMIKNCFITLTLCVWHHYEAQ